MVLNGPQTVSIGDTDLTKVKTGLSSKLKSSIRDAYARTARGHYIVRSGEKITFEGFNLDGATFVKTEAATGVDEATEALSNGELDSSKITTSGSYRLKVGNVYTINNVNNNAAKGSYETDITDSTSYEDKKMYAYNSQSNDKGNRLLTDDIEIDVWQFDSDAAKPESGELREPVMKINPKSGKVGFAFVAGPAYASMAGDKDDYSYKLFQRNYATFSNISMAFDEDGNSYGTMNGLDTYPNEATNTLAGRFTFVTSKWGTDTDSMDDNYNDTNKLRLESIGLPGNNLCYVKGVYPSSYTMTETRFASPSIAAVKHDTKTSVYLAYYDSVQGQIRFRATSDLPASKGNKDDFVDNIGLNDTSGGNFKHVFEAKTSNFSLIAGADWQKYAATENTTTGLTKQVGSNYFYDTGYKAGKYVAIDVIKNTTGVTKTYLDTDIPYYSAQWNAPGFEWNQYYVKDEEGNNYDVNQILGDVIYYDSNKNQIGTGKITGSNDGYNVWMAKTEGEKFNKGKKNTDVAYLRVKGDVDKIGTQYTYYPDVVVAVWYDGQDCHYAYNDDPFSGLDNGVAGGWKGNKVIFSEGGKFCNVKVGPDGSIHIAANVDGTLKYARLESYDAAYSENTDSVLIDGYGDSGNQITIDVGRQLNKNNQYVVVPYIGYYQSSCSRPAVAKLQIPENGTMDYKLAGADSDGFFTGNWEVSIIPTTSELSDNVATTDKINIGLWKKTVSTTTGVITTSADTEFSSYASTTANNTGSGSNGDCYGNGTANPILGYAVKDNTGAFITVIETAQMK